MHSASYLEDYKATGSQTQDIVVCDHSSISNLSSRFSASSVKEDISELPSENGSIKPSLEAELKKNARYEGEILRLRLVNDQLERNHESTMAKLTELHSQVDAANRKIHILTDELRESQRCSAELKAELHGALDRKQFLENSFEELDREKNALKSEFCKAMENVEALQLKAANLQKDLDAEIKFRKEAEMRYFELQKLHTE
jgi:chromosome segregation ATPase